MGVQNKKLTSKTVFKVSDKIVNGITVRCVEEIFGNYGTPLGVRATVGGTIYYHKKFII